MKSKLLAAISLVLVILIATSSFVSAIVVTPRVRMSSSSLFLAAGQTSVLTAYVLPASVTDKNVKWASNNAKVANVDSKGKVTAVGTGSAVITATQASGKAADKCYVTVTAKKEAPYSFSMMNMYWSAEPPKKDNLALKAVEDYTNTKITMIWAPGDTYGDKLNAIMAAGNLPKMMVADDMKQGNLVGAARSGMFWDVGPYLKDYPNLKQSDPKVLNNISIDGKVYGIYRWRPIARDGLIFRKDWLDAVGLKAPGTIDELYNVFKAFTFNDPDKDGKNDTFGIADIQMQDLTRYAAVYGAPNTWGLDKSGSLIPDFTTKEFMDGLKFYKRLYDDKLINQDFAVCTDEYALMTQGKAGSAINTIDDAPVDFNDLYKLNSKAVIDVVGLTDIKGPAGGRVNATPGFFGCFMFPKSQVKSVTELKRLLRFLDQMADQKMLDYVYWGQEGRHSTTVNGIPSQSDAQSKLYNDEVSFLYQFLGLRLGDQGDPRKGNVSALQVKVDATKVGMIPYAVPNVGFPYISETFNEKGTELQKIISDANLKFALGQIDEAGYANEVKKWKANGGDQIIKEMNAEYAKAHKK